jgi:hypothetical protein
MPLAAPVKILTSCCDKIWLCGHFFKIMTANEIRAGFRLTKGFDNLAASRMSWNYTAFWVKEILGIVLIARLLSLRLHKVYQVFCVFLTYELVGSLLPLAVRFGLINIDYRALWLLLSPLSWVLTLWMVYTLLETVLARLPGILRFSRRLLHYVFAGAVLASLISGKVELGTVPLGDQTSLISWAVLAGVILERVIFTIALIVLLTVIAFVVWFPVEIPKNLVLFCVGLVVYFSGRNAVLLAETFWADSVPRLAAVSTSILAACFVYWACFITPQGEHVMQITRRTPRGEHKRLIQQLETMNAALLRGARQ